MILVVGSPNSSNSNRLRELAEKQGVPAYLLDEAGQIEKQWLDGCEYIGVTAGASAPEEVVTGVVEKLREWGGTLGKEAAGRKEPVTFSLPRALQRQSRSPDRVKRNPGP